MACILVVADHDLFRLALANLLRSEGHEVEQAADGRQALEYLPTRPFDAVVMDAHLPHMDGLEACRRLRQRSQVPVLILATNGERAVQERALLCGASAFLVKPPKCEHLLAWLRAASGKNGWLARNGLASACPS
jgi:CheY-like chemotaxis protein